MDKKFAYFMKQKLIGVVMLAFTALSIYVLDGDVTVAVFTMPIGLYLIFTNRMIIEDDYYFEVMRRKNKRELN